VTDVIWIGAGYDATIDGRKLNSVQGPAGNSGRIYILCPAVTNYGRLSKRSRLV